MDERTLREIYLTGFEIVCAAALKPRAIAGSYNPSTWNPTPAKQSIC